MDHVIIHENVWYGIYVIFYHGSSHETISDGGIPNYLFINDVYKAELGEKWIEKISSSTFKLNLYPYQSDFGKKEFDKYLNFKIYPTIVKIAETQKSDHGKISIVDVVHDKDSLESILL